ncbi:MAG: type II toxin-antitoxin system prevent-host-death family antitoxin [Chloroflexota bacterium]
MNKSVGAYEAKTHLPRLLEEVAAGAIITITKHGVPVATLSPAHADKQRAVEAAGKLRAIRERHPLRGLTIRELIDEGRR